MSRVFFRPAAAAELDEAHRWFEGERAGLGDEFLEAARALVARLAENPLAFPWLLHLPCPVVRHAAGLHHHCRGRELGEEEVERRTRHRFLFATLPGSCDTATSKTTFAMSTATTVCFSTGSSFVS